MGILNLPDVTCFHTLICDNDVALESMSAVICPSGEEKKPGCKREPNELISSPITQCRQWNKEKVLKGCTSGCSFQRKMLLIENKHTHTLSLLFLRKITIKIHKRCLITLFLKKKNLPNLKGNQAMLKKRGPRLSQYMYLSKGSLPWKYLQLRCYPAPSHSPAGEQGQSTAVGSSAAVEQWFFPGKVSAVLFVVV